MVIARLEHEPVYHLYGSPGTVVMKGNSFIQADLNLVLYVAGPLSFLGFFGLGGEGCWCSLPSSESPESMSPLSDSESLISAIQKYSRAEMWRGHGNSLAHVREHKTLNFRLKTILKFKVLLVDQLSRP